MDDECPHGLDREWCTLCRQAASGAPPSGVKRRPVAGRSPTPRSPRAPRAGAARPAPPVSLTPAEALTRVRKVLFHATAYGAWESIAESGLRTAAQVLGPGAVRPREDDVTRDAPAGGVYTVREQRLMARSRIEDHLDGIAMAEWLELLNRRAYFFAQQKDLTTHLGRYQHTVGQDVLVFDTAKLLSAARGRVEITTVNPSLPEGFGRCRCRGPETFVALSDFRGPPADIVEVTVVDGLDTVAGLVGRVVRYHPGAAPEVLVG